MCVYILHVCHILHFVHILHYQHIIHIVHILHILHIYHILQAKAEASERGAEGAMTGDDYDLVMHCTIGNLRRLDGALPDFDDGAKALTLLASRGQPRCINCIFCIFAFCSYLHGLQTRFAHVAASLWILVLFHDSSCNWHPYTEDRSQIGSQD